MNASVPIEHIVAVTYWRQPRQRPTYYRLVDQNGELVFERIARRRLPSQLAIRRVAGLLQFPGVSLHGVSCEPRYLHLMRERGLLQNQPDSVREVIMRHVMLEEL